MPAVSVIIPTYQHSSYVIEALESVFNQTFTDYEIIVINDGSPDDTNVVLEPLAITGRIKYYEQANAGQAAARNRGLSESSGDYIAFLDDDDVWPLDKLEWQVAELTRNPGSALVGGSATGFRTRRPPPDTAHLSTEHSLKQLQWLDIFQGCPFVSPGQTLIRRQCIIEINGFNENVWGADDFDLYFRLAYRWPLVIGNRTSLYYRIHSANASLNRSRMFNNCLAVVSGQLLLAPLGMRWAFSRRIHRWLYTYFLHVALSEIIPSSQLQVFLRLKVAMPASLKMWKGLITDPILLKRILFDVFVGC